MATPIILKSGSVSGPSVAGQGSNDLVIAETVTLSDAEAANAGAAYFWEWEDIPIGSSSALVNHTTATPTFVPDITGSFRVKCTVDGVAVSKEIFAVPLPASLGRIPSFQEQDEYDEAGNIKGWHEAQTAFMRAVDDALGSLNASLTERNGSVAVPQGNSSKVVELGLVTYPGSLLAISIRLELPVASGTVAATVTVNGVDKFTATITAGLSDAAHNIQVPGTHLLSQSDIIRVRIDGTSYVNAGAITSGLAINVVMSNDITTTALVVPDASNTVKGLTKLSVAPAVATEPVAAGTNDTRIPDQTETDALVGSSGTPSSGNPYVTDSDSRNSDARAPTTHKTLHQNGGGDEMTVEGLNGVLNEDQKANKIRTTTGPTLLTVGTIADGEVLVRSGATVAGATGVPAAAHAASHLLAGGDSLLITHNEVAAANIDGVAGTASMRTLGTGAQVACAGDDSRLSDARPPVSHALGTAHSADTLANINAKVTGKTLVALEDSNSWGKNQFADPLALTDASAVAIVASDRQIFELLATSGIGATRTLANPTGLSKGMTWQVWFIQDSIGGRALLFNTYYGWGDEGVPDFTGQNANIVNIISCVAYSTIKIGCTVLTGF